MLRINIIPISSPEAEKPKKTRREPTKAPEITESLQDAVVAKGSDHAFVCHFTGSPKPDTEWQKDGNAIDLSQRFGLVNDEGRSELTIKDVRPGDQGEYMITVRNKAGIATTTATLTVEGKAYVTLNDSLRRFVTIRCCHKNRCNVKVMSQ